MRTRERRVRGRGARLQEVAGAAAVRPLSTRRPTLAEPKWTARETNWMRPWLRRWARRYKVGCWVPRMGQVLAAPAVGRVDVAAEIAGHGVEPLGVEEVVAQRWQMPPWRARCDRRRACTAPKMHRPPFASCCSPTRCACVLRSSFSADRNLKIILKYFIHFLPKPDACLNHNCSITELENN